MSDQERSRDERLQELDVHIVDVLAHLEALLRASHTIQRALLTLRAEAPPPSAPPRQDHIAVLHDNAHGMRSDCQMLSGIVDDLITGIGRLSASPQGDAKRGSARSSTT